MESGSISRATALPPEYRVMLDACQADIKAVLTKHLGSRYVVVTALGDLALYFAQGEQNQRARRYYMELFLLMLTEMEK